MLETGSLQTRKLIDTNAVDLGITILDGAVNDNYNILPLVTTELVFCVSKQHRLAKEKSVSIRQLAQEKIILFKADSYRNVVIKNAFAEEEVEPNILLYSSQLYTIKQFLSYGTAGAFLYRRSGNGRRPCLYSAGKANCAKNCAYLGKKRRCVFHCGTFHSVCQNL